MPIDILHRDDLELGGFAGLKEHRLVTDTRLFGSNEASGAWDGIGHLVYLADAKFLPKGETRLHHHSEVDVISVMVEGRIAHEGSLENGQELGPHHVQVQRAGGQGFSHNEINPDDLENRMIQLWVLPEQAGQAADYKLYTPKKKELTCIYGGSSNQEKTFASQTCLDILLLSPTQVFSIKGSFMLYLTRGSGKAEGQVVRDGDLLRGESLEFQAEDESQLILIRLSSTQVTL